MAQQVDGNFRSFEAGGAVAQYLLVELASSGKIAVAGAATTALLGTNRHAVFADGDSATVKLISAAGTHKAVASAAITVGAAVFAAANGKVAATGTIGVGKAITAAGADGEVIEILVG